MVQSPARSEEERPRSLAGEPALPSAILDATDALVIVTDIASGTVVGFNSTAEAVVGLPRDEIVGRPLQETCLPQFLGAGAELDDRSHPGGLPRTHETTTVSPSGAQYRIVWTSAYLTDSVGHRTHVVMTGVDVTAARVTGGLFGQLMDAAATIVLIGADQGGRITFCSSGAERMFDSTNFDLIGRWLPPGAFGSGEMSARIAGISRPPDARFLGVEISHQDRRGARQLSLGQLDRRSGGHQLGLGPANDDCLRPRDWMVTHADRSQLTVEMTVTPVTDRLGEAAGFLLIGSDVTEQRQSQDLLVSRLAKEAQAVERLQEVDRIRDNLVATVSHELRTPLTSIMGYLELLKDGDADQLTAQQKKWTDAMDRNGDRLLALVDDLLTLSTIDAGRLQHDSSPVDLREVISSAHRSLRPLIDVRRLTTEFHLPETPVVVQGDAPQLEQVLCSLIGNAVKFTEDGGTVECALGIEGFQARVIVSDNGIGIPESEQRNLFKKFFRSTAAREREIQGTGLGLSIASSIVSSHSGEISVVSALGRGTRVTVGLPLAEPHAASGTDS